MSEEKSRRSEEPHLARCQMGKPGNSVAELDAKSGNRSGTWGYPPYLRCLYTAVEDNMFADSLFSSSSLDRSHRGWTTLASFVLQALGLAVLLTLPIFYTEGLPQVQLRDLLLTPPSAVGPQNPAPRPIAQSHPVTTTTASGVILAPRQIPLHTYNGPDVPAAPPVPYTGSFLGVDQVAGGGDSSGITQLFSISPPSVSMASTSKAPPISHWMGGNLIRKVPPIYPISAKSMGIQGTVLLRAVIGRDGKIERVNVIDGHPLLVKSALDAVSQWLYRPYYLTINR
jgi:periplasmic protein TonB